MARVLITGVGGFLGSTIQACLARKNHDVRGVDKSESLLPKYGNLNFQKNLLDDDARQFIASVKPDVIIHGAAILPQSYDSREAVEAAAINKVLDDTIIEYSKKSGCRLLYSSSTSVYGFTDSLKNEMSPVMPQGPYASAKFDSEMKIQENLANYVIFRISAAYGPGQRTRTVLRIFIEHALKNQDLEIFGSGGRQQDFIYAEDIARAFLQALEIENKVGIFNITSGTPISMRELANLVIKTTPNSKSSLRMSGKPDPQENFRSFFDNGKAKRQLKWIPAVSLEEGIRQWALSLGSL